MRLFHVTLSSALPAILEEGLLPRIGPRAEQLGEVVPAVYCFGNREAVEDGLMGWMADAFVHDGKDEDIVILEIDAEDVAIEKNPDDFEFRILTCIAPSRIRAIFDEAWDEISPEHVSKACNSVKTGLSRR